jgi:putative transposase
MEKTQFSESQIVRILKEVESGRVVKEVCRENAISDTAYYNWKAKYGGMKLLASHNCIMPEIKPKRKSMSQIVMVRK